MHQHSAALVATLDFFFFCFGSNPYDFFFFFAKDYITLSCNSTSPTQTKPGKKSKLQPSTSLQNYSSSRFFSHSPDASPQMLLAAGHRLPQQSSIEDPRM